MKKIVLLLVSTILFSKFSLAQIGFDRSRIIFDASTRSSQSLVLRNEDSVSPFLAQAWIEDERGQKIVSPLAALPVLQRLDPQEEKMLRISPIGSDANLASDRETMYFLNVVGVPPKSPDNLNEVSMVIQSKLKLFYRPAGLPKYKENQWFIDIVVKKTGTNTIVLENPSPFYSVIYGFVDARGKTVEKDINLKPFGTSEVRSFNAGNSFSMLLIDDYGASIKMNYSCNSSNICYGEYADELRRARVKK
ncbi:molecular chaperone [Ignatzschineria rhizosphaerae]|uniref:Molecular chaperone n=1 Tax=Ignatzschineria rhizosphaerae TaxID=2923279 RepID=A0ABY3X4G6_9GAMM|nr:molecular chaperone [Ignatzschineria rhizosphaerae]UNM95641.1 molecular chaperone [Ignatzschineria rhizosphaerae]